MPFDASSYRLPASKLVPRGQLPAHVTTVCALVSCGSLNPIHSAHIEMIHRAKEAYEAARGSDVAVVGAFVSPVNDAYGKAGLAPIAARIGACRLAVEGDALISVDDWEGLQDAYVRTYYVLSHIRSEIAAIYPDLRVDIGFVCGGDLFETFYRPNCWKLSLLRSIFDEFVLMVASRAGSKNPLEVIQENSAPLTNTTEPGELLDLRQYADKIVVFELEPNETSSTLIRRLLNEKSDIPETVMPAKVTAYLRDLGAYE